MIVSGQYPSMLAPQLVGRLLSEVRPEQTNNDNVSKLLIQCDVEGPIHNALVPTYHCLHTPGGPLKYSLEGHQFAIFGFKITSDFRYIVSVSNKFITWDISTSDLSREVHPKLEGLMMNLEISQDSRFVASYTSNNQIIILNTLISEYVVIENPFEMEEEIQGLSLIDDHLIVYGQQNWCIYTTSGEQQKIEKAMMWEFDILTMQINSLHDMSIIGWSGNISNPKMMISTVKKDIDVQASLEFHSVFALNRAQTKLWACVTSSSYDVSIFEFNDENIWAQKAGPFENNEKLIQLCLSADEGFLIATYHGGFRIWTLLNGEKVHAERDLDLRLPSGVRNVPLKPNKSSSCVLSSKNQYAIAGIRKEMYIWRMESGELVKCIEAHIARIIDIQPLVIGNWNCVITSSMDRTVKVWNINYIFEPVHHIDRHESQIESVSLSTNAGIAVTVTRGCIGVWDLLTGKLNSKLADSALGAIVTHAKVTSSGQFIISAESGYVLYWNVAAKEVVYKEQQKDILQLLFFQNDTKCLVVSKSNQQLQGLLKEQEDARATSASKASKEDETVNGTTKKKEGAAEPTQEPCKTVIGIVREFPGGKTQYLFEVPIKNFKPIVITADQQFFVSYGYGNEKTKDMLFVHQVSTGTFLHKFPIKYPKFKDVLELVPLPDKAHQVAAIDPEKGNIIDIRNKKFVTAFPNWGGK